MNVNALVNKVNFVKSARFLKDNIAVIEEYPEIPQSQQQEQEITRNLLFAFLKRQFPGCRIRVNTHSIMLRLDGHIHRKANKLRETLNDNYEWRNWFENNHRNIYQTFRQNQHSFRGNGYLEARQKEGKKFLYIPFKPNRISNYNHNGLVDMIQWLRSEHRRDEKLSEIYDDAIRLMEQETERRERERREKYERELREYTTALRERLFRPISDLEESDNPADRVLGREMRAWCRENNKAPFYAAQPTYDNIVPVTTKVKLIAPPGSKEEGWYVLPMFEGYEIKEGYELKPGWGKVTKHDATAERARGGVAPIVVQDYIHTGFDMDYWKHLIPEDYHELLAVTEQVREGCADQVDELIRVEEERRQAEEARAEAERLERERLEQQQREEEARRQEEEEARLAELHRQEQERAEREQRERHERELAEATERAERQQRLRDELRQQVARQAEERLQRFTQPERQEAPDVDLDAPAEEVVFDTAQAMAEAAQEEVDTTEAHVDEELATPQQRRAGLYRRPLGEGHVYVFFTGEEERTYVRRGNAINAYRNAFDAEPTAIYHDTNYTEVVEEIA